jgi:hypothetical protein
MSRSVKGSKGPGFEYWSRRFRCPTPPGPWSKKWTHRLERRRAKQEVAAQIGQPEEEDDGVDYDAMEERLIAFFAALEEDDGT